MKDNEKNHIDEWLVKQIKQGINTIESVSKGPKGKITLYYTGHLQKDIYNNFPGRTSKKIFKGYRNHLNNDKLLFTQKRFMNDGYEYYVRRI